MVPAKNLGFEEDEMGMDVIVVESAVAMREMWQFAVWESRCSGNFICGIALRD